VYTPKFTSEANVEALLQMEFDASTYPSSVQVLDWIEEIETDVIERNLYQRTATDVYIDVPASRLQPEFNSYSWTYHVKSDRMIVGRGGGVLVPLTNVKKPIISIVSLYKNDADLNDAPDWVELTEGPGEGSSFILLTSTSRTGEVLGYALWFYDNFPLAGPKRLKMTYTYGYNVNTEILDRYCTLGVAIKVLQALRGTANPGGLAEFTGTLGTYVPTHYESRIEDFRREMRLIEEMHFPKSAPAFGFLS